MIKFRWFVIFLGLLLFLVWTFGCAPGYQVILKPDVYINYTPRPYNQHYNYDTYYLYSPIVVQNTSTTNFIEIALNGEPILPQRIPPGKTENLNVRVEIGEKRNVILTASCYTPSGKLASTAYREFYLNIRPYEQPADIWPVYCHH